MAKCPKCGRDLGNLIM